MTDKDLRFGLFVDDHDGPRKFDKFGDAAERAGKKVGRASSTSVSAGVGFGKMRVGVGKAFSGLASGVPIAGAAVVGLGLLGKSVIDQASNLELMDRKAHQVLGGSFPKIEAWAKDVGTRMGLTTHEVEGLTAGFADMLKPMGFSTDKAATMAQKFAAMAPILSEWSGGTLDVQGASEALTGAITGEYDSLQALGIPISAAQVQTEALKETGKKNAAALTDQDTAAAALKLIYQGSTDAQKTYAGGQDTLAAKTKEAKTRIKNLRDELLIKVTPWLTTAFTWFNDHWYDVGLGLLTIADGAVDLIKPLGGVAAGALLVGAALLYAAGAAAIAKGDFRTGEDLFNRAGGLKKQAGDARNLADELEKKARPAIQRTRDAIQGMKDKNVAITVSSNAHAAAASVAAALAGLHNRTVTVNVVRASYNSGLGGFSTGGGYAFGTSSARPGWKWVGEHGPELMRFRGGEQVLPADVSAQFASMGAARPTASTGPAEVIAPIRLVLDGKVVHESLLKVKRTNGGLALGLA